MTGLNSVSTSTLQENVFDELFRAIITGVLQPGERVTIRSLAEKLDVSVMPVREALRRLEAMGCITAENRKFTVNELSLENMQELYELRINLESKAARLACRNCTAEDIRYLQEVHEQFELVNSSEEFLQFNEEFHFGIYELSRKPITLNLIRILWDRISPYLFILSQKMGEPTSPKNVESHLGMINALKNRDELAMQELIRKDLSLSAERIIKAIKQGKFRA